MNSPDYFVAKLCNICDVLRKKYLFVDTFGIKFHKVAWDFFLFCVLIFGALAGEAKMSYVKFTRVLV